MFLSNLFAPWQETFADAGDGDKGGGAYNLGPLIKKRSILSPFGIHFGAMLGPF